MNIDIVFHPEGYRDPVVHAAEDAVSDLEFEAEVQWTKRVDRARQLAHESGRDFYSDYSFPTGQRAPQAKDGAR